MRRQQWGEAELNWGLKTFFGWISCCPCPLSSFRAPMVKGGCPERLGQPGRKKKEIPDRSAKGCKRQREDSQLWMREEGQG